MLLDVTSNHSVVFRARSTRTCGGESLMGSQTSGELFFVCILIVEMGPTRTSEPKLFPNAINGRVAVVAMSRKKNLAGSAKSLNTLLNKL